MNLEVWGQTDVGLKRDQNQDSVLVDQRLGLFIVADGMGGHRGGEVASALAVETSLEIFENREGETSPKDLIRSAFSEASRRIYDKATRENPELMGMGTTMVLAYSSNNSLFLGNVGDSRAYLFREGALWQLTEDHSLVNEQLKAGIITESELDEVGGKNVITRSVGFEEEVDADFLEREVYPGEIYLMCSDGLCGLINNEAIAKLCALGEPKAIVEASIEAAKQAGGHDNITVLVIKVL